MDSGSCPYPEVTIVLAYRSGQPTVCVAPGDSTLRLDTGVETFSVDHLTTRRS